MRQRAFYGLKILFFLLAFGFVMKGLNASESTQQTGEKTQNSLVTSSLNQEERSDSEPDQDFEEEEDEEIPVFEELEEEFSEKEEGWITRFKNCVKEKFKKKADTAKTSP